MKLSILYTAGLLDGEGTITLTYTRKKSLFRTPVVSVTSTTIELMTALKATYGGFICNQKVYKVHHLPAYSWRVTGSKAIDLCAAVLPHLIVPEKKYRANLLVTSYFNVTRRNGKYTEEEKLLKIQFENSFFHPSKP